MLYTHKSCNIRYNNYYYHHYDTSLPILHAVERLFIGDIVHEYEPHGAPVVRRCDSPVTFLARRVLQKGILKLYRKKTFFRKQNQQGSADPQFYLAIQFVPSLFDTGNFYRKKIIIYTKHKQACNNV